jgi:hypothetical protein
VLALICQLTLLAYHQATTLFNFWPFNGVRNYTWRQKLAEAGLNGVLMSLPPIGFAFHVRALMIFGVIYYFVLFCIELTIWWVLYLTVPTGRWRVFYNYVLGALMFNNPKEDASARWTEIYNRLQRGTITILPMRGDRPVPNLEHMILQTLTLFTAIVTAAAYYRL